MNVYNIIKSQTMNENKSLTSDQLRDCISNISKLDNDGHQNIFKLINSYNRENNLEYQGKTISGNDKQDIKFILDEFPIPLQHIIYKFSKIHLDKMFEEKQRNEFIM